MINGTRALADMYKSPPYLPINLEFFPNILKSADLHIDKIGFICYTKTNLDDRYIIDIRSKFNQKEWA